MLMVVVVLLLRCVFLVFACGAYSRLVRGQRQEEQWRQKRTPIQWSRIQ